MDMARTEERRKEDERIRSFGRNLTPVDKRLSIPLFSRG